MTFRELLDKYRAGQASEEERALVEAELEKSEAIADYLAEQVEDALGAAELPLAAIKALPCLIFHLHTALPFSAVVV